MWVDWAVVFITNHPILLAQIVLRRHGTVASVLDGKWIPSQLMLFCVSRLFKGRRKKMMILFKMGKPLSSRLMHKLHHKEAQPCKLKPTWHEIPDIIRCECTCTIFSIIHNAGRQLHIWQLNEPLSSSRELRLRDREINKLCISEGNGDLFKRLWFDLEQSCCTCDGSYPCFGVLLPGATKACKVSLRKWDEVSSLPLQCIIRCWAWRQSCLRLGGHSCM